MFFFFSFWTAETVKMMMTELSCMEGSYLQRVYQKESPTVLNYSNVLFISPLFKPKDIQYSVYSTGKLHK